MRTRVRNPPRQAPVGVDVNSSMPTNGLMGRAAVLGRPAIQDSGFPRPPSYPRGHRTNLAQESRARPAGGSGGLQDSPRPANKRANSTDQRATGKPDGRVPIIRHPPTERPGTCSFLCMSRDDHKPQAWGSFPSVATRLAAGSGGAEERGPTTAKRRAAG